MKLKYLKIIITTVILVLFLGIVALFDEVLSVGLLLIIFLTTISILVLYKLKNETRYYFCFF